jgi:hypothetical protein
VCTAEILENVILSKTFMSCTLGVITGNILYWLIKQLNMSICRYVNSWTELGSVSSRSCECPLSNRLRHGMVDYPGSSFDQYHPSSAEVKNEWSYITSPSIRLHGVEMAALCFP